MLERRGLKYREWAVEWEASAQDFLLEKGFSPEMGARPLRRARSERGDDECDDDEGDARHGSSFDIDATPSQTSPAPAT